MEGRRGEGREEVEEGGGEGRRRWRGGRREGREEVEEGGGEGRRWRGGRR